LYCGTSSFLVNDVRLWVTTSFFENHTVIANLTRSDQATQKLSLEQVGLGWGGVCTEKWCGQALNLCTLSYPKIIPSLYRRPCQFWDENSRPQNVLILRPVLVVSIHVPELVAASTGMWIGIFPTRRSLLYPCPHPRMDVRQQSTNNHVN